MKSIDINPNHGGLVHVADLGLRPTDFGADAHIALRVQWGNRDASEVYLTDADVLVLVAVLLSMTKEKDDKRGFRERVADLMESRKKEGGA